MSDTLLTTLLKSVVGHYVTWSPHDLNINTAASYINGVKYTNGYKEKLGSTGICFLVATFIQEKLKKDFNQDVALFFIWREFDACYGEDEDDTLHAGIYTEGKYYDTYNPEGVSDIKDLVFYQNQSAPHMLFTKHEPDWIQFGKDAFASPDKKEDNFINYLKEVLP